MRPAHHLLGVARGMHSPGSSGSVPARPRDDRAMAAFLAALSAVFFALAAALQQRGQFALARGGKPVRAWLSWGAC